MPHTQALAEMGVRNDGRIVAEETDRAIKCNHPYTNGRDTRNQRGGGVGRKRRGEAKKTISKSPKECQGRRSRCLVVGAKLRREGNRW